MRETRIDVTAYSGYRGEESPRYFFIENEKIEVLEILGMWIEEEAGGETMRFFRIRATDGYVCELFYREKAMEWFLAG